VSQKKIYRTVSYNCGAFYQIFIIILVLFKTEMNTLQRSNKTCIPRPKGVSTLPGKIEKKQPTASCIAFSGTVCL